MSKPKIQQRTSNETHRGPAERASGLDPELTAQPRPFSDEMDLETRDEPGLSVDADELGAHFLTEATEQGDFHPEPAMEHELRLVDAPPSDEPLIGPNYSADTPLWEQTVDLSLQSAVDPSQLRAPPPVAASDAPPRADEPTEEPGQVRLADASIRDVSLLDREGPEAGQAVAPDIDSDETGRHAKEAPRQELGRQVEPTQPRMEPQAMDPKRSDDPPRASAKRLPIGQSAVDRASHRAVSLAGKAGTWASRLLLRTADGLRSIAERVAPQAQQPAPRQPSPIARDPKRSNGKMDEASIPHLPIG